MNHSDSIEASSVFIISSNIIIRCIVFGKNFFVFLQSGESTFKNSK